VNAAKVGPSVDDYRPYFTYWISAVQAIVLAACLITFGLGPLGAGLNRDSARVLSEWLTLEQVSNVCCHH
jgi:hypothetical protein